MSGVVRVARDRKNRKGKTVTVLADVPLGPQALEALASELKRACGAGGTVVDGRIEIQGDHRERLEAELARRGFRTQRVGG
jgi:translation initiation factor 1